MRASFNTVVAVHTFAPPPGPYVATGLTGAARFVPQLPISNVAGGIATSPAWITTDTFLGSPAWSVIYTTGTVYADGSLVGVLSVASRPGLYYLPLQLQAVTPYGSPPYWRYLVIPWI